MRRQGRALGRMRPFDTWATLPFRSMRVIVMPKFLIEVPHDAERMACARAVQAFLSSGSHFVSNADWGCRDGDHRAWIVAEMPSKDDAMAIVPPIFRAHAKIVALNRFNLAEIEGMFREHTK
jgi:hypothetical protein